MIKKLLAMKKTTGCFREALQRAYFLIWLLFQRKSQQYRIKKAHKIMKIINQENFKKNPRQFFSYVRKIDPFVFEELLLLSFKWRGIKVIHNKRYTGDGGIDGIIVLEGNKHYAIQAKRYTNHVNSAHIKQFKLAIVNSRCCGGFFIHSGVSGEGVYQNLGSSIHLISGHNLHQLLTRAIE